MSSRKRDRGFGVQDSTVVSKLVELQEYLEPNWKIRWMIENLICLKIPHEERSPRLEKVCLNTEEFSDYIAVSYPWDHTPGLENSTCNSYTIVDAESKSEKPNKVRNVILERVIRYARAVNTRIFWIDRECIGQATTTQRQRTAKQLSMNAMDLVYGNSRHPLGMLAVTFKSQRQINTLEALIKGTFLTKDWKSYPEFRDPRYTKRVRVECVLRLLEYLLSDQWWSRAWIFQEEYVSSTRMRLLIRCRSGLTVPKLFRYVPGEVCVNAGSFRTGATRYLFALKNLSPEATRRRCARLLKSFGKYQIQYRFQKDFQFRAMSSRIVADIARRDISKTYDLLPIVANSCNYGLRFDSIKMKKLGYKVDLCVLAMCLLNGELIRDCNLIRKEPDEMGLVRYLQYSLFNRFCPPIANKGLTYLKSCRLHDVRLSHEGIHTDGHLWSVFEKVNTDSWLESPVRTYKRNALGLDALERDHLFYLLEMLRLREECQRFQLIQHLQAYLDEDLNVRAPVSPTKAHKDTMAGAVVRAMQNKEPLFLVRLSKSHCVSGVMVGLRNTQSQVFTSWYDGVCKDGRVRQSRISIEVQATQTVPPRLRTTNWVNGLVFYRRQNSEEVVFSWPKVWTRFIW